MADALAVTSVNEISTDPTLLKIAFATSDGEMVNQHFGSAQGFHVYSVGADVAALLITKAFGKEKQDGNEDKLKPKLAWLAGCDLVYCGSVGGSATKQLIALGVHPVVVKGGPDIEEVIEELQAELAGTPSPLLKRVLQAKQPKSEGRFDTMDDEGWEE